MKASLSLGAVVTLVTACVQAQHTQNQSTTQEDLSFAYEYLYPLYAYGNAAKALPAFARPNLLLHSGSLSEQGAVGVVRPNADTIYSIVFFDLSHSDIIIEVPEMPTDRYWVFPIVTPYGDHLVNLGNLNETPAGKYLLKYSVNGEWGLETEDSPDGFAGIIKYPMAYGISDMRILANRTDEDAAVVQELQTQWKITPLPRGGDPVAPRLDLSMFNETQYNDGHDVEDGYYQDVLRVAARLEPYCPTYVVEDRGMVSQRLENAGFKGEQWKKPVGTNLTEAALQANHTTVAFMKSVAFNARYGVAAWGYLGLTRDQSVYPSNNMALDLEDGEAVLFTFTEPPRIAEGGFWSLTVYGPDQDLIENELGRYSLGSEDSLAFPDGSPVTESSDEGVFQIVFQATEPPANWTNNWLPINTGGGKITTTLRWYGSEEYMTNGSYIHPKIEIIQAITSNSSAAS